MFAVVSVLLMLPLWLMVTANATSTMAKGLPGWQDPVPSREGQAKLLAQNIAAFRDALVETPLDQLPADGVVVTPAIDIQSVAERFRRSGYAPTRAWRAIVNRTAIGGPFLVVYSDEVVLPEMTMEVARLDAGFEGAGLSGAAGRVLQAGSQMNLLAPAAGASAVTYNLTALGVPNTVPTGAVAWVTSLRQ